MNDFMEELRQLAGLNEQLSIGTTFQNLEHELQILQQELKELEAEKQSQAEIHAVEQDIRSIRDIIERKRNRILKRRKSTEWGD